MDFISSERQLNVSAEKCANKHLQATPGTLRLSFQLLRAGAPEESRWDSMESEKHIEGANILAELFRGWPSYYDAEVLSFGIERSLPIVKGQTKAQLSIHLRTYAVEYSDAVHFETMLKKSVLVRFGFAGAVDIDLSGFNPQNVIGSFTVTECADSDDPRLEVEIEPIWGFGGSLRCESVKVEAVEAIESE